MKGQSWLAWAGCASMIPWAARVSFAQPLVLVKEGPGAPYEVLDCNYNNEVRAFLDSIPAWCPGDLDNDGGVTASDLLAFLAAWEAELPPADLTGDYVVDVRDLMYFLELFDDPSKSHE